MPDFLTDPRFLVPNVLAIIAIVVTVVLYFGQRKRKELTFDAFGISLVSPIGDEYKDKIKVYFQDQEVQEMQHFFVSLKHSGNEPIKPDDYEGELSLDFGEGARVYECEISYMVPKELSVTPVAEGRTVHLGNPLLNPGDNFYMGVLVTTPRDSATLNARIAGLRRVRHEDVGESRALLSRARRLVVVVMLLLALSTLYIGIVAFSLPERAGGNEAIVVGGVGGLASLTAMLAFLMFLFRDNIR